MLRHTFQHLEGIGPETEAELWRRGLTTWDAFLAESPSEGRLARCADGLRESVDRLCRGDAPYFQARLPGRERWRLYPDFLSDAAFLDIETTGLSPDSSCVTMVGILDASGFTAYVRGDNLEALPEALLRYRLFVTFNGAAFDLPFLEREFGAMSPRGAAPPLFAHAAHLDLMYTLRRMGLRGGLKRIEQATGLGRATALTGLSGFDAVRLWRLANEGEPGALDTLIRYNAEDVVSLPRLAALAVGDLAHGTPMASRPPQRFPEFDTAGLPFDRELVRYLTRGPQAGRR